MSRWHGLPGISFRTALLFQTSHFQLNWPTYPPMAILPLGTGNDLARYHPLGLRCSSLVQRYGRVFRCMGWGGVFSDEPLSQLLQALFHETSVTHLDRWVRASSFSTVDFACVWPFILAFLTHQLFRMLLTRAFIMLRFPFWRKSIIPMNTMCGQEISLLKD